MKALESSCTLPNGVRGFAFSSSNFFAIVTASKSVSIAIHFRAFKLGSRSKNRGKIGGISMFNMTKIKAVNGAGKTFYANHLSANDYYSEHEKIIGGWYGSLAGDFDLLMQNVEMDTFSLFQRNINPLTGRKLTQRTVASGVRFFDFQCAAPKSVSIMALFDPRLAEAHDKAVFEAMEELEKLAAVRIRKGDNARTNNLEITGKILYGRFRHDASRSLDPQLHTHNVVVNVTRDSEGRYKALESLEMCKAIRYAGKVYHNALSRECRQLGYEMVDRLDDKGNITWQDIKGVSEELMERFSKRRHQIEEEEAKFIAEHGRKPTLSENNFLSISTRDRKMQHSDRNEVRNHQLMEMSAKEQEELRSLAREAHQQIRILPDENNLEAAKQMILDTLPLIFERESVVKLDKVLAEAMNQNLGQTDLQTLKKAAKEIPELCDLGGLEVNPWVSPEIVIEQEIYAVKSVEECKAKFSPPSPDFQPFPGEENRKTQGDLIRKLLNSPDQFNLFRGVAGSGKTSTLQEFCRGLQSGGINSIYLIAPTNSATDVLKQEGFEQSQTVASFLLSKHKPPEGSYVIIDESGLNSLREGVEIINTARQNNYRVLFVGDARQHTAVESGDFFRLLEDHSKIEKFSLTEIHRQQQEEYRCGITECALGRFEEAFDRFDRNGFICEGKADYLQQAADSYMKFTENGKFIDRAILVTPTHDEKDRLTDAVRERLKAAGCIAESGRQIEMFRGWNKPKSWVRNVRNYVPGTTIAFIRNLKDIGNAGETAKVVRTEGDWIWLDSGKCLKPKSAADFIEVGELHEKELCSGDLIQFNVNIRERKIYNGSLARMTDDPRKAWLLYSDGSPRELIDLPDNFAAFQYGWATTSHKSQGRTAENVVAAAQTLDRKTFYVALSRGRQNMVLHCPEKEFLKRQLEFRHGDRISVHDLAAEGKIAPGCLLPLSEDARKRKAKLLPDIDYKSIGERLKRFADSLKTLAQRVLEFRNRRIVRRSRAAKYPTGPITEKTPFEIEQDHPLSIISEKTEDPGRKTERKTSSNLHVGAFAWMAEQKRLERAIEAQNETSADRDTPPSLLEQVLRKMPVKREPERPQERKTYSNPGNDALAWLAEQTRTEREKDIEKEIPAAKEPSQSLPDHPQPEPMEQEQKKARPELKEIPEPEQPKKKSRGMDI